MPNQLLSNELTLNYAAIRRLLWDLGEEGLREALEVMETKAKKFAPVRDVFDRDSNRRPEAVPRGIQRRKRYTHKFKVFGRKIRHYQAARQDLFFKQVRAQQPKRKAYGGSYVGKGGARKGQTFGSSRDFSPVLGGRQAIEDRTLREVGINESGVAGYRNVPLRGGGVGSATDYAKGGELNKINDRLTRLKGINPRTGKKIQGFQGLSATEMRRAAQLASKSYTRRENMRLVKGGGKPYVPTAREASAAKMLRKTALHVSASGDMTVGGRLRDEIFSSEIMRSGLTMYGDVIAPTEYAKYQEYGTSHHRAQPFMRPALYEMRNRFPVIVKRAMRKGSARKRVA